MNMLEPALAGMVDDSVAARPLFVIQAAEGQPAVVTVDGAGRLLLARRHGAHAWTVADLSPMLPGPVRRADVRQAPDGTLCIALALEIGGLLVATGVPASSTEDAWLDALRATPRLADGASIERLAFGPLQSGAPPLLLVAGSVDGAEAVWWCNAAEPLPRLHALDLPASGARTQRCAIGTYRLPGLWTLHPEGQPGQVRFTSFRNAFPWQVDVAYPNLPAQTASMLLAPGSMPNVPDLYAAGDRIVVYRGGNNAPQHVADVAGARLVWANVSARGEHVAYADGDAGLWLLARAPKKGWREPVLLTARRAALALAGHSLYAASLDGECIVVQRFEPDGTLAGSESVVL
jgi:hypothetical protein